MDHRKITCLNKSCGKEFGFYMFDLSDRLWNEAVKEAKAEVERLATQRQAKVRRAEAMARRGVADSDQQQVTRCIV